MIIPTTSYQLLTSLINQPSVTPNDAGCMDIIGEYLKTAGFDVQIKTIGEVKNFWAIHGIGAPLTVLAGHTDVVPAGDLSEWQSDPFKASERDGYLYGRGAADMKSGVATMCVAAAQFVKQHQNYNGSIAVLLTSDEEGPAQDGIKAFMPYLIEQGVKMDYAIFTEPSSVSQLGDMIKNGRRGSMHCYLTITGRQGHVAYPQHAANPIHALTQVGNRLTKEIWCEGNMDFPPTSMQIWEIKGGVGAGNVIPHQASMSVNFRFSTELSSKDILSQVEVLTQQTLNQLNENADITFNYDLSCHISGEPFLTPKGKLIEALNLACDSELGIHPVLSTSGGTSDARFVAPYGVEVVEFGPVNKTIHQVNECIKIEDIKKLEKTYLACLKNLYGV